MAVSKVNYGDDTLIDLTADTVTPSNLMKGATAHDSAGNSITGILEETEITTILSADSTDNQVPSSKCVYNAIRTSSVQSDYEQNDSSQSDYIKNRTHYKEVIHQERVDLLPETEIDFSSLEGMYSQSEPLNIQVGDTVKVLWNSQEYECVAQSAATLDTVGNTGLPSDCIVLGNLYYVFEVDPDSRDIPFVVIANYTSGEQEGELTSGCCIQPASELTNPITVNIFTGGDEVVYHKLDVNYLPISESNISSDKNNIVTSKPLLTYLNINRPDWGISDKDDPRYIKNRPFYRSLWDSKGRLITRTITLDENGIYASKDLLYNFNDIYDNSYGDISLTVHWHDGTYNCIFRELYTEWTDEEGLLQNCNYFAFGNVSDINYNYNYSSDSAPFLIYANFNPETHKTGETYIKAYDGFTGELTLQVDAEYRYWGYNTLDNKYLNLSTYVFQGNNNPVTGDAVYDAIESVKGMIPSVPSWAMQSNKPSYSASEVGADASGTATSEVSTHNTNTSAHNDLRLELKVLSDRLKALADSDDTTLDQMSEIVKYIKNNKSLIDNVTTTKVNVTDIIDNLTTNVSNKPLSAAQGVALKSAIDSFFGGKTVVFRDAPPTVDDQNVITFVKRG